MTDKLPCKTCGVLILPITYDRNDGKCIPCKKGTRAQITASQVKNKEDRIKAKEHDPWRELWRSLVERDCRIPSEYASFTKNEKIYYAVTTLDGEVLNGGFHQYFGNSSGELYAETLEYLNDLDATHTIKLLTDAKSVLFGNIEPPKDQIKRNKLMHQYPESETNVEPQWSIEIGKLDNIYYSDPDKLHEKLRKFAIDSGILNEFMPKK